MNYASIRQAVALSSNFSDRDHWQFLLHSKRTIGFRKAPHLFDAEELAPDSRYITDPNLVEFVQRDPAYVHGSRVILDLIRMDNHVYAIKADRNLSDAGRAAKLDAFQREGAMAKRLATHAAAIRSRRSELTSQQGALYAVPAIAPTDAATAIRDMEIRQTWAGMSHLEQVTMLKEMRESNLESPFLPALMRSPIPVSKDENVRRGVLEAWHEAVALREPQKAAALNAANDAVAWAEEVAGSAVGYLTPDHLGKKSDVYAATKDVVGGPEYFGLRPDEIAIYGVGVKA